MDSESGALYSSAKDRDEFLQIASHELKTPVAALQLQLQLMKRQLRKVGDGQIRLETFQHELDSSLKQVSVLTHLINDLLDVSHIRTGQLTIHAVPEDLSALFVDVVDRYQEMLREARCVVSIQIRSEVRARIDAARFEQVLVNLVSNVCKYAPGSAVVFSLVTEGKDAVLTVRDEGPGVRDSELSTIFERFTRAGLGKNVSGLGLGLFIAKAIIESHHGSITLTNEAKGLRACIRIPRLIEMEIEA